MFEVVETTIFDGAWTMCPSSAYDEVIGSYATREEAESHCPSDYSDGRDLYRYSIREKR